jgi:hypothetical protein
MERPDDETVYLRAAVLVTNENEMLEITLARGEAKATGKITRDENEGLYEFLLNNATVIAKR